MDLDALKELLDKYNISSLDELEHYLDIDNVYNECSDDPEDKNCINSECYEDTKVPDCRKIILIYQKYFQNNFSSKKEFGEYLARHTSKSISSIENYLSCKSCSRQMQKSIHNSLKISDNDFKKDFCANLEKKFNYQTIFGTEYISIKSFLLKEHEITKETFKPQLKQGSEISAEEKNKLFDITQVSKEKLKINLSKHPNLKGSADYQMNLALAAFNRNLFNICVNILGILENREDYNKDESFFHLKAKVLSSQEKDKEAIHILRNLKKYSKLNISTETNNLLAASIKREAIDTFLKYNDEKELVLRLSEARDIYRTVFKLNDDYYPALNYMYLESILNYINNADQHIIESTRKDFESIWNRLDIVINDWWSYIFNIEYLILLGAYDEALTRLDEHFETIDSFEINDFNLMSTTRQLDSFSNFCDDEGLKKILIFLKGYIPAP